MLKKFYARQTYTRSPSASERDVIKKKSQRSPFFFISSLTNSGLGKKSSARLVLTCKGGLEIGSGEREGATTLRRRPSRPF